MVSTTDTDAPPERARASNSGAFTPRPVGQPADQGSGGKASPRIRSAGWFSIHRPIAGRSAEPASGRDDLIDRHNSDFEDRFIAIGPIEKGLVVIVHTEREEDIIRIIGARWANTREQSLYRSYMDQNR